MRDPARIAEIIDELERLWFKHPDWRFGQLVRNVSFADDLSELFNIEDDKMLESIITFEGNLKKGAKTHTTKTDPPSPLKEEPFDLDKFFDRLEESLPLIRSFGKRIFKD